MSALSAEEMQLWSRYVHDICGIHLDASKGYLIETRLKGLLAEHACVSYAELHNRAKLDPTNRLRRQIVDAITTNETSFFRDTSPFEMLQYKILPDLIDRRTKSAGSQRAIPLRIWSAACSTGQEVYSVAIVLKELLPPGDRFNVHLQGTDISDKAVAHASRGEYSKLEIERGLPAARLSKYFLPLNGGWKVRDELRAMTTFRTINLLEPFSFPPYDVIFVRNVAIYFTEEDRARLFSRIAKCLAPDGYLIIGSTESITGLCPQFEPKRYLRAVFYQFKSNAGT